MVVYASQANKVLEPKDLNLSIPHLCIANVRKGTLV